MDTASSSVSENSISLSFASAKPLLSSAAKTSLLHTPHHFLRLIGLWHTACTFLKCTSASLFTLCNFTGTFIRANCRFPDHIALVIIPPCIHPLVRAMRRAGFERAHSPLITNCADIESQGSVECFWN